MEGQMGEVRCEACTKPQHEAISVWVYKNRETLTKRKILLQL